MTYLHVIDLAKPPIKETCSSSSSRAMNIDFVLVTFSACERLHLKNKSSTETTRRSSFWCLAQNQCSPGRDGCGIQIHGRLDLSIKADSELAVHAETICAGLLKGRITSRLRYSEQVTIYGWNGVTDVDLRLKGRNVGNVARPSPLLDQVLIVLHIQECPRLILLWLSYFECRPYLAVLRTLRELHDSTASPRGYGNSEKSVTRISSLWSDVMRDAEITAWA